MVRCGKAFAALQNARRCESPVDADAIDGAFRQI